MMTIEFLDRYCSITIKELLDRAEITLVTIDEYIKLPLKDAKTGLNLLAEHKDLPIELIGVLHKYLKITTIRFRGGQREREFYLASKPNDGLKWILNYDTDGISKGMRISIDFIREDKSAKSILQNFCLLQRKHYKENKIYTEHCVFTVDNSLINDYPSYLVKPRSIFENFGIKEE
jgi:hypothetical protein